MNVIDLCEKVLVPDSLARWGMRQLMKRRLVDEANRDGEVRSARFNHLPPGKYRFEVSAETRGSGTSSDVIGIEVEVQPRFWEQPLFLVLAGLLLALPVGGGAVAAVSAATGNGAALACLGVAWLLQRVRAALRGAIARRVLPADAAAEAESALRRGRWWQPVAHALHLLAWIGSAAGRHLDWAGRRYRLGPDGEVLGIERLPNGRPAGGLKPRRPPA